MITNPEENNVKLPTELSDALSTANQRLYVIQSETQIATKALNAIKAESATAIKDKAYQEEQLAVVTANVKEANRKFNELNESILKANSELSGIYAQIDRSADDFKRREVNIRENEEIIEQKLSSIAYKQETLEREVSELEEEKKIFNKKVADLKEVISSF